MLIYILIVFCCVMLFMGGWIVGFIHGYTQRNRFENDDSGGE